MADNIRKPKRAVRKGRDLSNPTCQPMVDAWNAKHPIGAHVRYWHVLPFGPTRDTATKSEAWIADSGDPVIRLDGVAGFVSLLHVVPASELHNDTPPFRLEVQCEVCDKRCEPIQGTDSFGVLDGRFCSQECLESHIEKSMTAEKPIAFAAWGIRAALSGRKCRLTRPVKPQPQLIADRTWVWPEDGMGCKLSWAKGVDPNIEDAASRFCPWQPGQLLYVREAWGLICLEEYKGLKPSLPAGSSLAGDADLLLSRGVPMQVVYRADGERERQYWRQANHIPRDFSRLALSVTAVRVQRLQEITRLDIVREGWPHDERQAEGVAMAMAGLDDANIDDAAIEWFADKWDKSYGKTFPWASDPWCWFVSFQIVSHHATDKEPR